MSKKPWMPFDIGDYQRDTGHLSVAEHGAYLMLIMHYWVNGGLPDDERMIARLSRMSPDQWAESRDILAGLFRDGWRHKRIDEELSKADEIIGKRKAAANARHSGSKRDAHAELVDSTCTDTGVPPSPSPEPREEKPRPPVTVAEEARAFFDELWAAFPQNPTSSEAKAEAAFSATKAEDRDAILAAARRYRQWFAEDCVARKRTETAGLRFAPHLATWLADEGWRDAAALPVKAEQGQQTIPMTKLDRDHDHDLWKRCEDIMGKKAPTDGTEWWFLEDVVARARQAMAEQSNSGAVH